MRWEKPTWIELDTEQGTVYVCSQDYVATAPNEESGSYIQQYRPPVTTKEGVTADAKIRISRRRLADGRVEVVGVFSLSSELWGEVMKNFEVAQKEKRVAPKVSLRIQTRAVLERPAVDSASPSNQQVDLPLKVDEPPSNQTTLL